MKDEKIRLPVTDESGCSDLLRMTRPLAIGMFERSEWPNGEVLSCSSLQHGRMCDETTRGVCVCMVWKCLD